MGLRVRLQRHIKVFRYIKAYGEKKLKTYCTKCNEINICHLDIQKHVSYEKWFKYHIFFVYRFTENFSIHYGRWQENFQSVFYQTYTTLNVMKLKHFFFKCTIACFIYRITPKISDILWDMRRNGFKYIFNRVTWFLTLPSKV